VIVQGIDVAHAGRLFDQIELDTAVLVALIELNSTVWWDGTLDGEKSTMRRFHRERQGKKVEMTFVRVRRILHRT
jgi:hypothetical protein